MKDSHNREISYLRVSVTDRCNLRCVYCMPPEGISSVSHADILTFEELERVCGCAAKLGIRHIRLTGGEPLARRGITELVRGISAIDGIERVSMTTNGTLLGGVARELFEAGLSAVNVSLDTLEPTLFRRLTRGGELQAAIDGIDSAFDAGMKVKINCVPMCLDGETPEQLGDRICAVAQLARERPIDVRFIELMPIGEGSKMRGMSGDEALAAVADRFGTLTPDESLRGGGPASYFSLGGFAGKLGVISAVSHAFCSECNRVRLTAEGFLKLCLQYDHGLDLRGILRGGATDAELTAAIAGAIMDKPARHRFGEPEREGEIPREPRRMAQIGG